MGAWGTEIYQNDFYADIRDFYIALLKYGMTDSEALELTLDKFNAYINDNDEKDIFWILLADIMWQVGRLSVEIKEKALEIDINKWIDSSNEETDIKLQMEKVKKKLTSDQPPVKKFKKKKYKKCSWNDGDIFRYEFHSECAIKYDMSNMYLFVQKIGDYICEDTDMSIIKTFIDDKNEKSCDIYPIIRMWISDDKNFVPSEVNKNECIPTMGIKNIDNPKDYRYFILDFPGKCKDFEYICNSELIVPDIEDNAFITENNIKPKHLTWKFFDKHVIGRYIHWTKGVSIFK